jgi:hypothetical protein
VYHVVTKILLGGKVVDVRRTPFGFRQWEWDSPQFKLNGVPWNLRGDSGAGVDGLNNGTLAELFLHLPIGYIKSPSGEVLQEPDEQARGVVQLVFDKFEELGTVWRVFCYVKQNKIQFGYRCLRGPKRGQLEWRRPAHDRIPAMLRHPIYAGAYAYGIHRPGRKNPVSGQVEGGKWFLSPDEIRVLIQGRVPAYIRWHTQPGSLSRVALRA